MSNNFLSSLLVAWQLSWPKTTFKHDLIFNCSPKTENYGLDVKDKNLSGLFFMLGYNATISKQIYRLYLNFIATIKASNSNLVTKKSDITPDSPSVCSPLSEYVRRQETDRTAISFLHEWPQEAFSEVQQDKAALTW